MEVCKSLNEETKYDIVAYFWLGSALLQSILLAVAVVPSFLTDFFFFKTGLPGTS